MIFILFRLRSRGSARADATNADGFSGGGDPERPRHVKTERERERETTR